MGRMVNKPRVNSHLYFRMNVVQTHVAYMDSNAPDINLPADVLEIRNIINTYYTPVTSTATDTEYLTLQEVVKCIQDIYPCKEIELSVYLALKAGGYQTELIDGMGLRWLLTRL